MIIGEEKKREVPSSAGFWGAIAAALGLAFGAEALQDSVLAGEIEGFNVRCYLVREDP